MEWVLDAMVLVSPVGLAILGCVAFGFALAAREALGRERGRREEAERARDAAVRTLSDNRDWEITHARKMAARAPAPALISPPANDEAGLTAPATRRDQRRALEIVVDDDPTTIQEAPLVPPEPTATVSAQKLPSRPPPVARPASSHPLAPPRVRRCAVEMHAPRVPHPEPAAPGRRDGLPAPLAPRLGAPVGSGSASGSAPVRRAATLTDFPMQSGDALSPRGDGWTDAERSPLNATLRGVGG
jgi:hypothetical protein